MESVWLPDAFSLELHGLLLRNGVVQLRNGNEEQCETRAVLGECSIHSKRLGKGKASLGQWRKRVRWSSPVTTR